MAKGYVETTVLVDWLLKPGERRAAARHLLDQYAPIEIPGFAVKELKAGPLKNVVWMHNTLQQTASFANAIGRLQRMSMTPRRYTTATALEALQSAAKTVGTATASSIANEYGSKVTVDEILAERYRLALRHLVLRAWRKRYAAGTQTQPLSCYVEHAPAVASDGLLSLEPTKCAPNGDCCLAAAMKHEPAAVQAMRAAILRSRSKRREDERRCGVLRSIVRHAEKPVSDSDCRRLGDAVFAFFAPSDSTILTTNIRDLELLAKTLGKKCAAPTP